MKRVDLLDWHGYVCLSDKLTWLAHLLRLDLHVCSSKYMSDKAEAFLDHLNNCHHTHSFEQLSPHTAHWSSEAVSFLDIHVPLIDHQLKTDLHCKPDTHQYLHQSSCHPTHCKMSLPYSLALCIRQICSKDNDFYHQTRELKKHAEATYDNSVWIKPSIKEPIYPEPIPYNHTYFLIALTHHPSLLWPSQNHYNQIT